MTKEQTLNVVARIYGAYGRNEPPKHALIAWHEALQDEDVQAVLAAWRLVRAAEREMPSVATFLNYVEQVKGTSAPGVVEAEAELRQAIAQQGRYVKPVFSHPALANTVNALGWENICDTPETDLHWMFVKTYENAAKNHLVETAVPGLGTSTLALSLGQAFGV